MNYRVREKLLKLANRTLNKNPIWNVVWDIAGYECIFYSSTLKQYTTEDRRITTETLREAFDQVVERKRRMEWLGTDEI